ncbi:hypothetical protein G6F56_003269 [Rhizopus delemar]|nr:hypothetical protein G6F56_003269 [Rhizopus delemar]
MPQSTAQSWMSKGKQVGSDDFVERRTGIGRPVSRPPILDEEHKDLSVNLIDEKPFIALDEMTENLADQFSSLQMKKTV